MVKKNKNKNKKNINFEFTLNSHTFDKYPYHNFINLYKVCLIKELLIMNAGIYVY